MTPGRVEPEAETDAGDAPADGQTESDEEHDHLRSLDDGAGCTEIWEHLSENRGE
jgi:hypothetical protein